MQDDASYSKRTVVLIVVIAINIIMMIPVPYCQKHLAGTERIPRWRRDVPGFSRK
jgi:hypothetical protein